ncbi:hypothetical protein ABZ215_38845 [Amycolatopsis sp. NPDC006131]|uniref:hypothetical protein n=1 Tax=Amycolatopsis sp. NPDC006131 TaxID=3156731 RepID=UPI0033AE9670
MSTNPDRDGTRTALATGAFLLLPALCCGLPLLIAGGALAGLGSVLGNPWVIGAAIALLVAVVVCRIRRRARGARSSDPACCAPEPPTRDQGK